MNDSTPPAGVPENASDPRLAPTLRVVVEMQGGKVTVNANVAPEAAVRILTEGICCMVKAAEQGKSKSLVVPANGAVPPPLRKLERP